MTTATTDPTIETTIAGLTEQANQLAHMLPSADEIMERAPDWAQQVRFVETRLGNWRRALERATIDATGGRPVVGEDTVITSTPKYEWRFNPQRILVDVTEAEGLPSPMAALLALVDAGALKLNWSITALRTFLRARAVDPEEVTGEDAWRRLDELDGPHAGRRKVSESPTRVDKATALERGIIR